MKHIWLLLLLVALLISCAQEAPLLDEETPAVEIIRPQNGQRIFLTEKRMPVKVTIAENLGLHTYFIWLVEESRDTPYLVDKDHVHTRMLEIELDYELDGLEPGRYRLLVDAVDHDYNRTETDVLIEIE